MSLDKQSAGQTWHPDPFEYDVAISFASHDKPVAEEFTGLLNKENLRVFRDEYTAAEPWGKDVVDHLVNIYARKARYCVMLISHYYPLKQWTEKDRRFLQERAFRDANEYILPVRLDDAEVLGLNNAPGYQDLRTGTMEHIINMLEQKIAKARERSGPPSPSHDLRSGNVSHAQHESNAQ